jgi:hypothetical protein
MLSETIRTHAHTTRDGRVNLSLDVGLADVDVTVVVEVRQVGAEQVDESGWPRGFLEQVAGTMPELRRWPQGQFEERLPL